MKVIKLACTLLMTAWVSSANASLIFDFSFTDILQNNAKVTGEILGLSNNNFGAASSVRVFSNSEGYGVGEYVGLPDINTFEVLNGSIVFADFKSFGVKNSTPDVTDSSLRLFDSGPGGFVQFRAGLTHSPSSVSAASNNQFTQLIFVKRNVPVPAPSSLILLSLGLAGLSFARYRKQS
jgi:hypothetical protein